MLKKNFAYLFLASLTLISLTGFTVWNYIEKSNRDLPFFVNGKPENSLSDAQKDNIIPVPSFSFINQNFKPISQQFIKDKIWVADFFFTRCTTICPKMSNHLEKVQKEFASRSDFKLISFTCDPERDTPEKLIDYAAEYHADSSQWQFATGTKQSLYHFARKGLNVVATDGDGGANDFIHSQNLVLVDKQGYVRGYYDGTKEEAVQQLIKDIRKLQ
jgi:protein SCO1/2